VATIVSNDIVQNYDAGIAEDVESSCTFKNNIVAWNDDGIDHLDSGEVSYNDVWGNVRNYHGLSAGPGDISLDPKFADKDNGDFRLQDCSPCINEGDPESPEDPDSTQADIGVYYSDHPSCPPACPFLYVWDGSRYAADNNVLAWSEHSAYTGLNKYDYYLLRVAPPEGTGRVRLQLRENVQERSLIESAALYALDLPEGIENICVSSSGTVYEYLPLAPPVNCVDQNGKDVLELVRSGDDVLYAANGRDSLVADFGEFSGLARTAYVRPSAGFVVLAAGGGKGKPKLAVAELTGRDTGL
ncbi:MAG: hypothetical protein JRI76_14495, partial [Deltaproteobacteria bacterium]|nr:hypothetical protein [Deltaproteobacteria bacterium]